MVRRVLALVLLAQLVAGQDILVVTPKEFGPALADWRAHRAAQGHAIAVAEPGEDVRSVASSRVSMPYANGMFVGDPATRIPRPAALSMTCAQEIAAGKRLKIVGESSMAGESGSAAGARKIKVTK